MKLVYAETTLKEIREVAATETEDKHLLDFALETAEMSDTTPVVIAIRPNGGTVDYAVFEGKALKPYAN